MTKNAARVFCEINSTQAKVKKDLLYLIKYDVLGERNPIAAAGKVILQCDKRDGILGGMFRISSLRRKNRLNFPCIGVVDIIENELSLLLSGIDIDGLKASEEQVKLIFNTQHSFSDKPLDYVNGTMILLERYFSHVKSVFSKDWVKDGETFLLTEPYILALIRLLRYRLFNRSETIEDIQGVLKDLKTKIDLITVPEDSPSFPETNLQIPDPERGYVTISNFLIDLG